MTIPISLSEQRCTCGGKNVRVIISKTSIFGLGVNLQHCSEVAFVGLSHSFELWYQAVRRTWRFGQTKPVNCHMISSAADGAIAANLKRKAENFDAMAEGMLASVRELTRDAVRKTTRDFDEYKPTVPMRLPAWLRSESE